MPKVPAVYQMCIYDDSTEYVRRSTFGGLPWGRFPDSSRPALTCPTQLTTGSSSNCRTCISFLVPIREASPTCAQCHAYTNNDINNVAQNPETSRVAPVSHTPPLHGNSCNKCHACVYVCRCLDVSRFLFLFRFSALHAARGGHESTVRSMTFA